MGVHPAALLSVFLLTAVATVGAQHLPDTEAMNALALVLDLVPFIGALAVPVLTVFQLRRRMSDRTTWPIVACCSFAATLVGALGVAHLVSVTGEMMATTDEHRFVYDFRAYSLIQLGVALIACGSIGALLAPSLERGEGSAWHGSLAVWVVLLIINGPLIPLQGFAILFSILAVLCISLLLRLRSNSRRLP